MVVSQGEGGKDVSKMLPQVVKCLNASLYYTYTNNFNDYTALAMYQATHVNSNPGQV